MKRRIPRNRQTALHEFASNLADLTDWMRSTPCDFAVVETSEHFLQWSRDPSQQRGSIHVYAKPDNSRAGRDWVWREITAGREPFFSVEFIIRDADTEVSRA